MADPPYNLAIETSGRHGSVSLGRGDDLLASEHLTQQRRHNVGLMPAIDRLCREHGASPRELRELYVSLGPGSFTGLRVGITTAKMIALATGAKVVGVPTLEVLSPNAPDEVEHVAVGLNLKRETLYSAVFRRPRKRHPGGNGVALLVDPALRTLEELLRVTPRPAALIAEKLPDHAATLPDDIAALPPSAAVARSEIVWHLGRERAKRGDFTVPAKLRPLYVREPEAVTLWNQRHDEPAHAPSGP